MHNIILLKLLIIISHRMLNYSSLYYAIGNLLFHLIPYRVTVSIYSPKLLIHSAHGNTSKSVLVSVRLLLFHR